MNLPKVIISPPFGTHLNVSWATSILGTYTYNEIKGNRLLQGLKTIRPVMGGWINKIGLINPGLIQNKKKIYYKVANCTNTPILSLYGKDYNEWDSIIHWLKENNDITPSFFELNVSCPNLNKEAFVTQQLFQKFVTAFPKTIVKLPPLGSRSLYIAKLAFDAGILWFHCCNTYPTSEGGISGNVVKWHALPMISEIKKLNSLCKVIGGGGIYTPQDAMDYFNAGADRISLSTIWFTPWKVRAIKKIIL